MAGRLSHSTTSCFERSEYLEPDKVACCASPLVREPLLTSSYTRRFLCRFTQSVGSTPAPLYKHAARKGSTRSLNFLKRSHLRLPVLQVADPPVERTTVVSLERLILNSSILLEKDFARTALVQLLWAATAPLLTVKHNRKTPGVVTKYASIINSTNFRLCCHSPALPPYSLLQKAV